MTPSLTWRGQLVTALEEVVGHGLGTGASQLSEAVDFLSWDPLSLEGRMDELIRCECRGLDLLDELQNWDGRFQALSTVIDAAYSEVAIRAGKALELSRSSFQSESRVSVPGCFASILSEACLAAAELVEEGGQVRICASKDGAPGLLLSAGPLSVSGAASKVSTLAQALADVLGWEVPLADRSGGFLSWSLAVPASAWNGAGDTQHP